MQSPSLFKQFLHYAIPTVLSAWVYSAYTLIDGIFIGRYVGSAGLAAFNLLVPLLYIPYACSVMVGVGGSTLVARMLGARQVHYAAAVFTQALWLLLFIGLAGSVLFGFGAAFLVKHLGATGELHTLAQSYLVITAGFTVFATLSYALELFLRVDGAARIGLYCLSAGAVANIALDYLFIVVWGYGMNGAAWATGISHAVAALLMLAYHIYRAPQLKPVRHAFARGNAMFTMAYNGLSELLGELAPAVTILAFNWVIVHELGQSGLVAYAVLEYLTMGAIVTMVALVQSMQPLVSFHRGAANPRAMQHAFRIGSSTVLLVSIGAVLVMLTQSSTLIHLFLPDGGGDAQQVLGSAVLWYALAFIPAGANLVIAGFFTAIEAPSRSALIAILRSWVLLLGALWLGVTFFGAQGIWFALLIAELLTLVVSLGLYWQHRRRGG